jgi:MarR family transcriptional regulator, organic hydroperoxide resistance regulator
VGRSKRAEADETGAILRHWQTAVPDDRLAHLVKDATRALLRALQMRLAAHSVSIGHWTFLRILWEADGITQRELSVLAGVMEPTTFSAVNAMEKLGFVTRRQLPDSRRKIYIFLTSKGRLLKRKLVPLAQDVNDVAVQSVPAADVAATRRTLLAVLENLARDEARAQFKLKAGAANGLRVPGTREPARRTTQAGRTRRTRVTKPV